jgi:tRNA(Arg) A34 adenosine deaminase TadA
MRIKEWIMDEKDVDLMRCAIEVALKARKNGNHPFGAIFVDELGTILLESENTVLTDKDCTAHAELNLIRQASKVFQPEFLAKCSLYTSTEPCPMCAGAIYWGNIRWAVFGLSEEGLYEIAGSNVEDVLLLHCREVFARGYKPIEVIGPILEDEARNVHEGFWT